MKVRIVNKNALRMEITTDQDMSDCEPICIGTIGKWCYKPDSIPTPFGFEFLMLEVYLFYKDFKNAS
jgi:hypothetical protein